MSSNKTMFSSRTSALVLGIAFGASALIGGMSYAQSLTIPSNLENAVIAIKEIYLSQQGTSTTRSANPWQIDADRATIYLNGANGDIQTAGELTVVGAAMFQDDVLIDEGLTLSAYACNPSEWGEGHVRMQEPGVQETCILVTDNEGVVVQTGFLQTVYNHSGSINEILGHWKSSSSSNEDDIYFSGPNDVDNPSNILVRIGILTGGNAASTDAQLVTRGEIQSREGLTILRRAGGSGVGQPSDDPNSALLSDLDVGLGQIAKSSINQNSNGNSMIIQHLAANWWPGNIILRWKDHSSTPIKVGINTDAPTEALEVNGNTKATSYLYRSDARYKSAITSLDNALNKVLALNGYSYYNKLSERNDIGIIAQEVEKVFPELVHTDAEWYKSVEYGNLVAPLIEAVKELNEKVDNLEARLQALEAK